MTGVQTCALPILTILEKGKVQFIHYTDEPNREGVKPCANYLFESLVHTGYGEVLCVVLTGMGADGTQGITSLTKEKNVTVLAQNQETCAVFGMPRSIIATGLVSQVLPIEQISQEIIMKTGVR